MAEIILDSVNIGPQKGDSRSKADFPRFPLRLSGPRILSADSKGVLILDHVDDKAAARESSEHDVEFVETGEDAAKAPQPAKYPLHLVATLVEVAVVFSRLLADRLGGTTGSNPRSRTSWRVFSPS